MDLSAFKNPHQLSYTIHSCSNCSANYHPFTILEDSPTEPSSRWSGSGPPNPSSRPIIDHHHHHHHQKLNTNSNNQQSTSSTSTTTATTTTSSTSTSLLDSHHQIKPINPNHPNHHPNHLLHSSDQDLLLQSNHSNYINPTQLPKKKDYIIIDLGKPCIVRSITFGKFHRPHPCNVKLFRIWGSLAPGEGKGDFRALLLDQPNHPHHQLDPNSILYDDHHHQNLLDHSSSSHQSHQLDLNELGNHPQQPPIRVRGERHRSGPKMELLAQGELKNDPVPETVPLRWKNDRVAWFKTSSSSSSNSQETISTFNHQTVIVPIRYIKIEPLSAAGSNYNCSIWHVSVKGHDEDHLVLPCLENYEKWRASAALRLCLKHLRQAGHYDAFQALIKSASNLHQSPILVPPSSDPHFNSSFKPFGLSNYQDQESKLDSSLFPHSAQFHFEHSLVAALHSALVPQPFSRPMEIDSSTNSDPSSSNAFSYSLPPIDHAEQIAIQASSEGLFDQWARAEPPTVICQQIRPPPFSSSELPCPRGGHQMCIDNQRRKIWLFGGFNGFSDLGDLWVYHLEPPSLSVNEESSSSFSMIGDEFRSKETGTSRHQSRPRSSDEGKYNKWERISHDVKQDNGPINRSCHKMVVDEMTGDLYVLGRYTERGRMDILPPSASTEGIINGNLSINPARLSVQTSAATATNLNSSASSEAEQIDVPASRLNEQNRLDLLSSMRTSSHSPITSQTRDQTTTSSLTDRGNDEVMSSGEISGEAIRSSINMNTTSRHYDNDFFRFRPFKDPPSSDEFWNNDGRVGKWECLSQDTFAENGPPLIFDHQVVLDSETRKIYVFGGKIIQPIPSQEPSGSSSRIGTNQYSGLYEYDIPTRTWTQLMPDIGSNSAATPTSHRPSQQVCIPSRMGHSLILDKKRDCLWVLTGERDHHYYSDLWKYDIRSKRAELVVNDYTYGGRYRPSPDTDENQVESAPEAGFSQRTTFDAEADEWHMFCGLCRDRGSGEVSRKANQKSEMMSSEFWRWRIDEGRWKRVIMKAQSDGMPTPPPRFAHQMVFDSITKTHYVFGGNPADNDNEPTRLGDFWKLKLIQPTRREALRRCLFALRRQKFIEMCEEGRDPVGALIYLQNDLSAVTNHLDGTEGRQFRACTSHLLSGPGPRAALLEGEEGAGEPMEIGENSDQSVDDNTRDHRDPRRLCLDTSRIEKVRHQRTLVFQDLSRFFPPSMTEPVENLVDLIDVWADRDLFW